MTAIKTNHSFRGRLLVQPAILSCLLTALVLSADAAQPQTSPVPVTEPSFSLVDELAIELAFSVSNRYVTEGIDNVPGTPFVFSEVALGYRGFEVGLWYGEALSDIYNEVIPYVQYTFDLDPVEIFVGINYVWYPSAQDPDSWEYYGGIEYTPMEYVTLFLEGYYDFVDIRGGFIETGIVGNVPFPDERVGIHPYVMLGIDYGYVSGVRQLRQNNFQFGIEADFQVSDNVAFFGYVNRTISLSNLRAIDEGNVTWGGAGIRLTF